VKDFFGECDKKDGKIVNTNPLWTKKKQISDMKDDIDTIERQEEDGLVLGDARARALKRARKNKLKKTLAQIDDSNPVGKVKGKELDEVKAAVDSFIEEVRDKNPSHHDDNEAIRLGRSTISPNVQGKFSKTPCIKLKNESEVALAKKCGMRIEDNMVSKDDMTRGIWLMQEILGQKPDHNQLKRDMPRGHVNRVNQVQVPNLPEDMQESHKEYKKASVKASLSQG